MGNEFPVKKIILIDSLVPGLGGNKFNIENIGKKVHLCLGKEWDLRNVANTKEQAEEVARRVRNLAKNEGVQRNISVRVEGGSMDIYKLVVKAE